MDNNFANNYLAKRLEEAERSLKMYEDSCSYWRDSFMKMLEKAEGRDAVIKAFSKAAAIGILC
jgi:oligoribonuclease NrnB/cAMP/cGMP phosphodiesterase (DHH superfamily)